MIDIVTITISLTITIRIIVVRHPKILEFATWYPCCWHPFSVIGAPRFRRASSPFCYTAPLSCTLAPGRIRGFPNIRGPQSKSKGTFKRGYSGHIGMYRGPHECVVGILSKRLTVVLPALFFATTRHQHRSPPCDGRTRYGPPEVDRIWLWVYHNKISIILPLKGDYKSRATSRGM